MVLPRPGGIEPLKARCLRKAAAVKNGEQEFVCRLTNGVQLDVWIARPATRDLLSATESNYGTLFLCRTGSVQHNIFLVEHAKKLGLVWKPHDGVFHCGNLLASETEEEIFAALGLKFVEPERREK